MQPTRPLLTRAEYEHCRRQLEDLRRIRDADLPRLLRDARTFVSSDAAEEIVHITVDHAVAGRRIAQLQALLRDAAVVEEGTGSDGVVAVGSTVLVKYVRTGATATYRVGGIADADAKRFVSARSPVGRALLDGACGDVVDVALPSGAVEQLLILSVDGGEDARPVQAHT